MASMPELGSKISLISKSDIRYEGQLYTVDPNECTIALANVRSYGTEDRDGQFAIPPQEEIFDYILFRGSDIKDIRVVNNVPRVPHDPAIMQMHVSNQPNFQPQFSMMPHAGGQIGPFGGANNQPGPFNALNTPNAQGGQLPQGTPGLPFGQQQPSQQSQQQQTPQQQPTGQQQQQQQNNQQPQQKNSVLDLITGGSRSTTPVSLNSRKSPTAEMGVQVNQKDGTRRNNNRGQQGGRLDSQGSHENRNQQSRNNQYQGNNNQNRGGNNWGNRNNNQNVRNNQHQRPQRRGPGLHPQSFRQNQNSKGRPQPKTTIKFESDFDFEQANTKFEEVRLSLAKLKVGEEAKPEQVNGEAEKKDDSGNETGAGEQEQEDDEVTLGYDKTKSFFDNISCEAATDRKGKNRTDWRLERKLNSETFGVSSARRGGYFNYNRGRPGGQNGGSYFNNNRNMGYRNNNGYIGNNGGYRGGNFRNNNTRNFNNQRNQNQGNNPQENPTTSLPQEKQQSTQQSQPTAAQAPAVAAGGK